jgi:arylformamidase
LWFNPTIGAAIAAGLPWLTFSCPGCGQYVCARSIGTTAARSQASSRVADHPALRGAIPVSGIFDLEPIALGVLNEKLRLSAEDYVKAARARGLPVTLTTLPSHHHFSILDELARPDGSLTHALIDLIK